MTKLLWSAYGMAVTLSPGGDWNPSDHRAVLSRTRRWTDRGSWYANSILGVFPDTGGRVAATRFRNVITLVCSRAADQANGPPRLHSVDELTSGRIDPRQHELLWID